MRSDAIKPSGGIYPWQKIVSDLVDHWRLTPFPYRCHLLCYWNCGDGENGWNESFIIIQVIGETF